jgi:hypothetical protein
MWRVRQELRPTAQRVRSLSSWSPRDRRRWFTGNSIGEKVRQPCMRTGSATCCTSDEVQQAKECCPCQFLGRVEPKVASEPPPQVPRDLPRRPASVSSGEVAHHHQRAVRRVVTLARSKGRLRGQPEITWSVDVDPGIDADKTGVNVVDGCLNEALRGPVFVWPSGRIGALCFGMMNQWRRRIISCRRRFGHRQKLSM